MTFKASNSEIFFATLSAERKQTDGKETSSGDDEPDENEELAEEYASLTVSSFKVEVFVFVVLQVKSFPVDIFDMESNNV